MRLHAQAVGALVVLPVMQFPNSHGIKAAVKPRLYLTKISVLYSSSFDGVKP